MALVAFIALTVMPKQIDIGAILFQVAVSHRRSSYAVKIRPQSRRIPQGIAPTLIIFRVALGHARPDDDWSTARTNTHLEFGGMSQANKQTADVETGEKTENSVG